MSSRKPTPEPVSSRSTFLLGGVAAAIVAIIVVVVLWNRGSSTDVPIRNDGYGPAHNPAVVVTLQPDGAQLLGLPTAAKTLDIYEDSMCPGCGALERSHGQELAQAVDHGKLAVRYHLLAFLDPRSDSGNYSSRAAAAFRCLAQTGAGPAYSRLHSTLFTTKQPKEGGSDYADAELADLAKAAGTPESAVSCITGGGQLDAAKTAAKTANAALAAALGRRAETPSVFAGKAKLDLDDPEWVVKAER